MANTLYVASNPSDGVTTYQNILIERAPDSGGSPGAFGQIASVAITANDETTNYTDTSGTGTDWYRHRWQNTGATLTSGYSGNIQAGDYLVRQWIIKDIAAADLTTADWDRWRDQIFLDLQLVGAGKPSGILSYTPASDTDEWHDIDPSVRTITRVDVYDSTRYISTSNDWYQWGRQIRLGHPNPRLTYKYQGVGEIRNIGDLADEGYMILFWGLRLKYLQKRLTDRGDFRVFLTADKISDVTTPDVQKMVAEAQAEYNKRVTLLSPTFSMPAQQP